MKVRKNYLIIGILIFLVGAVVIFPIESKDSAGVEKLVFTYLTVIVGVVIALYGLLNSGFLKGLLLIFLCIIMSVLFTALVEDDGWGRNIVIFWLGVPSGAISGVLFLIINRLFIKNKPNSIMLYIYTRMCFNRDLCSSSIHYEVGRGCPISFGTIFK